MGRKNHPPDPAPAIPWHFCMQMRRTNDDNGNDNDDDDDDGETADYGNDNDDDDDDGWMALSQYHQQVVALIDQLAPLHNNCSNFHLVKYRLSS